MKIKLTKDVYNIAKRIKEIDKDYYIVFNTSKGKFEVHNSMQIGGSYCLTLPYSCLDERTLTFVRKTSSTNIDYVLNEIENDNNRIESAEKTSAFNNVCESIENLRRENESY